MVLGSRSQAGDDPLRSMRRLTHRHHFLRPGTCFSFEPFHRSQDLLRAARVPQPHHPELGPPLTVLDPNQIFGTQRLLDAAEKRAPSADIADLRNLGEFHTRRIDAPDEYRQLDWETRFLAEFHCEAQYAYSHTRHSVIYDQRNRKKVTCVVPIVCPQTTPTLQTKPQAREVLTRERV